MSSTTPQEAVQKFANHSNSVAGLQQIVIDGIAARKSMEAKAAAGIEATEDEKAKVEAVEAVMRNAFAAAGPAIKPVILAAARYKSAK